MDPNESYLDIGVCCFCNNECNAMSQSCGSCSRQLSMSGFSFENDMEETSADYSQSKETNIGNDDIDEPSPKRRLYCICKTEFDETRSNTMIGCDKCDNWYHLSCLNIDETSPIIRQDTYICQSCLILM